MFEIGDKIMVDKSYYAINFIGKIGTIINIENENLIAICFDEDVDGHDCDGILENNNGWYIDKFYLKIY